MRAGGGANHRFGLDDAVLIKDNHIAIAGGVAGRSARVRAHVGHLVKIEVEVDTLAQLEEALGVGVDAVLLDNMSLEDLRRAVAMIAGRAISEASGRVTPGDRARDRRDRRRSHFRRLADAQRADPGYRAGLSRLGRRLERAVFRLNQTSAVIASEAWRSRDRDARLLARRAPSRVL